MSKLYIKSLLFPTLCIVYILVLLFFSPSLSFAQTHQQTADSLIQKLSTVKKPIVRINLLNEIAYANRRISGKATYQYAILAKQEAEAANYTKGSAIAHKNLGIALYKMNAPADTVIYHYNIAIKYAEEINDYYTQAACYNNIALAYKYKKNPHEVLQHYIKGIEIFDTHIKEERSLKALMLANIAQFHFSVDKNKKALHYIERAFDIANRNHYKFIKTNYSDDYGSILIRLNRYEEAEKVLQQGLSLSRELEDEISLVANLNFLSELAILSNQCGKAKAYQKQLPSITKENQLKSQFIDHQLIEAQIAYCERNYNQAIAYAELVYINSQKIEAVSLQKRALKLIEEAMLKQGNYRKAYHSSTKFHLLKDSLSAAKRVKLIEEVEAKFQSEEQEKEIEFLEKTNALTNTYIQRLWGFVGLVFLGTCYIFFLLYKKREHEQVINAKNKELEKYIASNLQLENFAYIASHDLRTPLLTMQSFANLVKKTAKDRLNKEELQSLHFVNSSSKDMITLVDDLMNFSSLQKSTIKKEKIYLQDFIKKILDLNKSFIQEQQATIDVKIDTPYIYGDRSKLLQLFQNLILNAIKFHKRDEKPKVLINCFANSDN